MLPKIIDLFSGCGGLALGFEKAGFDIVAGIELMPEACKTISYNLSWRYGKKETHICGDITEIEASVFKNSFGDEGCIVIGGPPCQAYSMAGRGKLRSLGEDRVNIKDARGYLYQDFLRFVFELEARAVVMENVPESTNFGGKNIPEIVCTELTKKGYKAYWTILNSADYGVPQVRERVFVVAIKGDEGKEIKLPNPTHRNEVDVLTQHQKRFEGYKQCQFFVEPNGTTDELKPWVTVGDAFSDLPEVFPTADSKYKLVSLNIEYPYKTEAQNEYQKIMRTWYGKEGFGVSANAFRRNTRDFPIFERMQQGDNYIAATKIAEELFYEEAKLFGYEKDSEEYISLYNKMVPQYDKEKFENKWKKLDVTKPSHTLVAHLGKDTYSHIHPIEPRGITVREAARLQSFPDDFFFDCSMGDAFKQIGNAVPPLLAYGVAKTVLNTFEEEYAMGILEEIREYFASTQNGAREIKTLPKEYSAMVIRDNEGYGVAIEFDDIRDISEKFANSRLFSRTLAIGGIEKKYLILSCMLDSLRYEFATVCAQFVEPGIDGMDRKNLMSEPLEWWKKWRELMGNTISNKEAYSVIAEMMVLDDLYTQDNTVEWTAVNSGSHDIEGNESSYEVKSTVKRYGATITISGQHQLQSLKRLQLYFCRLEQSRTGISINDMKDRLVADGYDKDKIEQQLYQLGYERGASIREEKYKVLEKRKYEVDDTFPKITKASFKDDHIPESITQITYTIDLDGLEYTVW